MGSDDELAERLRDGDERALRTAYDAHGAAVLYLAQRLLGNRADAEDVTQLTFVAVVRPGHLRPAALAWANLAIQAQQRDETLATLKEALERLENRSSQ